MADKKTLSTFTPGTMAGSPVAPNPTGVPQTTIDTDTTTINPNSSILNPVKPDGSPAPDEVKRAVVPDSTLLTTVKTTTAEPKPEGSER